MEPKTCTCGRTLDIHEASGVTACRSWDKPSRADIKSPQMILLDGVPICDPFANTASGDIFGYAHNRAHDAMVKEVYGDQKL